MSIVSCACSQVPHSSCVLQGMKCVITYTKSTEGENFYGEGADAKVPDLGSRRVTLNKIFGPLREKGLDAEILVYEKD